MAAKKKAALAKTEEVDNTALAVPSFVDFDGELGSEHITKEDMRIPRLVIAQALSPQMQEGDPAFIEGLKVGDAFNDLTNEIYGRGPLDIIVIRADAPRWVEFGEDRGLVDANVPADDPRTQFTVDEKGQRIKPVATKFYDYVVLLGDRMEPVALSFKSSGLKTAAKLNGLLNQLHPPKGKRIPIFACKYRLTSVQQKNEMGVWYLFAVAPNGYADEATYNMGKGAFETWKEKDVNFETTPEEPMDPDAEDAEKEM